MKVFALIRVCYDYHEFETLETVSSDLDELKNNYNSLPMFSHEEVCSKDFESPSCDGASHYYYVEYDV
jgi:hypothetical protein